MKNAGIQQNNLIAEPEMNPAAKKPFVLLAWVSFFPLLYVVGKTVVTLVG